jgi:hypothetical protein
MKHLATLLALSCLTACATDAPTPATYCPNVAVLEQARSLPLYLPGRQDVAAQITDAQVTGVAGTCTLEKKKAMLRVTFKAGFSATNGPANNGAALALPYFVAISHGDTVVSKSNYSIALNFDGNQSAASAVSKPVTVELANVPASAGIDILVGFQLSDQQLSQAAQQPPAGVP